jgi:hypothetical protein
MAVNLRFCRFFNYFEYKTHKLFGVPLFFTCVNKYTHIQLEFEELAFSVQTKGVSSETLVSCHNTIRRYNPEYLDFSLHRRENLKSGTPFRTGFYLKDPPSLCLFTE